MKRATSNAGNKLTCNLRDAREPFGIKMTDENLGQQIAGLRDMITRTHAPEIMTTSEAAAFLGVADETLFRWRKDRFGPRYSQPTSRTVRYLRDDLLAFLQESRT